MTDWDAPIGDCEPNIGVAGWAFIGLAIALAWLICAPFDLYARLRNGRSTTGDDAGQSAGADWSAEGSFETHNDGCNAA